MIKIIKNYYSKYLIFEQKNNLSSFREVAIFAFIILAVHFSYNFLSIKFGFKIFGIEILPASLFELFARNLQTVSVWVLRDVIGMKITEVNNVIYISNYGYIAINHSCSGLKQYIQFASLMLLYPGPWKHKTWFIPAGLFIIYLVNVLRIVGLGFVVKVDATYFELIHTYVFRPIFYIVIFFMWVIWVEKIKNRKEKKQ